MDKILLEKAKGIFKNAYAPYSKYRVAAVLKTKSGMYYTGVNVENASYSLTICAERTAIFCAVKEGDGEFEEMLIYTEDESMPYPCGACRQVLSEFADRHMKIHVSNSRQTETITLGELFPKSFEL